jgi:ligand-binding SRPBCC domain-containing protein
MLDAAREALTRGPHPGRRDRAEPLANRTRPKQEWVMNHFQMETRVEAPVEHVWAFMCDRSHLEDWTRARASDVSGPLDQVGTTFVQTSRTLGFEMKGTLTVLEVEPMRLLHLRSDMGPDMVFRFAPEGDATHLTFETDYEMPGHIPGFVKNLMTKSYVERQMRRGMEDIKAFAEATVPAHA